METDGPITQRDLLFNFPGWQKTLLGVITADLKPSILHYFGRGEGLTFTSPQSSDRPTLKAAYQLDSALKSGPSPAFAVSENPFGLALDQDENLYVTIPHAYAIEVFSRNGERLNTFGTEEIGKGADQLACGLVFDNNWNLVLLTNDGRLLVFDRSGKFKMTMGKGPGENACQFVSPRGITLSNEGQLIVTDHGNCRIQLLKPYPSGEHIRSFGSRGGAVGQLLDPIGVACGPDGNILVAEMGNKRIQIFDPLGKSLRIIPSLNSNPPFGIDVDSKGNIVVLTTGVSEVNIFSNQGELLLVVGRGKLKSSTDVVIAANGDLLVVEYSSHCISLFG